VLRHGCYSTGGTGSGHSSVILYRILSETDREVNAPPVDTAAAVSLYQSADYTPTPLEKLATVQEDDGVLEIEADDDDDEGFLSPPPATKEIGQSKIVKGQPYRPCFSDRFKHRYQPSSYGRNRSPRCRQDSTLLTGRELDDYLRIYFLVI